MGNKKEVWESSVVLDLLNSIARGNQRAPEIIEDTGRARGNTYKYLNKMLDAGLINKILVEGKIGYKIEWESTYELLKEFQIRKLKQLGASKKLIKQFKADKYKNMCIDTYKTMLKSEKLDTTKDIGTDGLLKLYIEEKFND